MGVDVGHDLLDLGVAGVGLPGFFRPVLPACPVEGDEELEAVGPAQQLMAEVPVRNGLLQPGQQLQQPASLSLSRPDEQMPLRPRPVKAVRHPHLLQKVRGEPEDIPLVGGSADVRLVDVVVGHQQQVAGGEKIGSPLHSVGHLAGEKDHHLVKFVVVIGKPPGTGLLQVEEPVLLQQIAPLIGVVGNGRHGQVTSQRQYSRRIHDFSQVFNGISGDFLRKAFPFPSVSPLRRDNKIAIMTLFVKKYAFYFREAEKP